MDGERTLVFLKSYLGDAVMATPMLRSLRQMGKPCEVWAAPAVREVVRVEPETLHFVDPPRLSPPSRFLQTVKALRAAGFNRAILVNRSFRSALLARLANIPVRVGHRTEGRGFLLTHALRYDRHAPESESYLALIRALGEPVDSEPPAIWLSEADRARGTELLAGATVGVQPGARYAAKQLPVETLARAVRTWQAAGHRIAAFGGSEEREAAEKLQQLIDAPLVDLVGRTSLRETLGALAGLRAMVGSDTGVMHLAAGVGCPTVTVFGPTPADKWGHHRPPHRVLRAPGADLRRVTAEELHRAAAEVL